MGSRLSRPDVGVQYSLVSTKNKGKETSRLSRASRSKQRVSSRFTVSSSFMHYCMPQTQYLPSHLPLIQMAVSRTFPSSKVLNSFSYGQRPKCWKIRPSEKSASTVPTASRALETTGPATGSPPPKGKPRETPSTP